MSAEAMGWVFRHSPLTGAGFLIHLAVADSVNDQNDNRFWMAQRNLAAKTRVDRKTIQRVMPEIVEGGFLEILDDSRGHSILYRFLFPDVPVQYETRSRVRQDVAPPSGQDVAPPATQSRTSGDTMPPEPKRSQRNPTAYRDKSLTDEDLMIAERSAAHRRWQAEREAEEAEREANPPDPDAVKDQLEQARKRLARKQAGVDDETAEQVGG